MTNLDNDGFFDDLEIVSPSTRDEPLLFSKLIEENKRRILEGMGVPQEILSADQLDTRSRAMAIRPDLFDEYGKAIPVSPVLPLHDVPSPREKVVKVEPAYPISALLSGEDLNPEPPKKRPARKVMLD